MGLAESPWHAIVSAALIGTDRQPFTMPTTTGKLGQLLPQLSRPSTEAKLLRTAATLSLHQHAGWQPEMHPVPTQKPGERDDLPRCSPRAARFLAQMLQGQHTPVLPEWLAIAAQVQQRVPERYLPELLDLGRQKRDLRTAMLPVLGQRGRWLATQNPDWSYAVEVATEEDWETGSAAARSLYLQDLRSQHPDRARERLQTTWSQEAASDRAKFLETFRTGLSMADEPFLEDALVDSLTGTLRERSKDVRRIATDLLASLPESRLCQKVTEHTCRYLLVDHNEPSSLKVQLPDHLDQTLMQLGIELKPSSSVNAKLGEKAWWLLQMIAATSLNTWTDRWQMSPQKIVKLTKSHDWQMAVLDGFILAAKRQKNNAWLEAIFKLWFAGQASTRDAALINLSVEDLFKILPPDRQDALLIDLLQVPHQKITDSLTIWLLRYSSQQWSLDLTRLVLDRLQNHLDATTFSNSDWELRAALKEFACLFPVALTSEAIQLRNQMNSDFAWTQSVDEFLTLLQFRQEIMQAFETENGG